MPPFFIGIERRFAVVEKRVQSCKNRCFFVFYATKTRGLEFGIS